MFNEQIKNLFLDNLRKAEYSEGIIKLYNTIFNKSEETEKILGKDIYEMNLEECRSLLKSFSNRSIDMFNVNRSLLDKYKAWSIKEGLDPTLLNFFSMISSDDAYEYVDVIYMNNRIITYEEMLGFESKIANYQDYICILLPFLGINGKASSEMIDLEVTDVYEDHIELYNRTIPIDSTIYRIIQYAIEEDTYLVDNGNFMIKGKNPKRKILPTKYVIRRGGIKNSHIDKVDSALIQSKVQRMQKYLGNSINITNLMLSGKVHFAKEMLKEKDVLTKEDWIELNLRFGYSEKGAEQYAHLTKNRVMKYIETDKNKTNE